ncbi:carbohydrate ABC transporter permease [Streptomyces sp. NPDC046805]|uniref:carbohydrate ABC transporter permease n=1 Tax=Streptomyces sp. NPDC046805 TaxID=3155134 RepID=UPI0033DBA780
MITRREKAVNYAVLCLFAALSVFPLLGVAVSSLSNDTSGSASFAWPRHLNWANFTEAWSRGHFSHYLLTSAVVAVSTVAISGVLGILAGYAFAAFDFPGRSVLFYVMLIGLMVPEEAFVIPLYFDLRDYGLTDTYAALILPQVAQSLGFAVFWLRNAFRTIPRSVVEAARIDGASDWRVLWRIIVPTSRPALVTLAMLVFMWTWNAFLLPLVMVQSESLRTAPLGLAFFQGAHTTQFSLLAAAAIIVALPVVVLYLFMQRHFIAGMLTGAVKE